MEDDALSGDDGALVHCPGKQKPESTNVDSGLPIEKEFPFVNYWDAYTPTQPSAWIDWQLLPPEGSGTKM
jgi:hypothetical protein